jgi:SAM-dependent methyltransferase
MTYEFDKGYWDEHWQDRNGHGGDPANPYLAAETRDIEPGTALDAGCGEGAEAIWLASHGWDVTAVDIASAPLARAAERAAKVEVAGGLRWVEADLTTWEPGRRFDLVTTHYAHPEIPQLAFYDRISRWVASGGTLLLVGHLHTDDAGDHGHGHDHAEHPPAEASATLADIIAGLDARRWEIVTADEHSRSLTAGGRRAVPLRDVVVRATRRPE